MLTVIKQKMMFIRETIKQFKNRQFLFRYIMLQKMSAFLKCPENWSSTFLVKTYVCKYDLIIKVISIVPVCRLFHLTIGCLHLIFVFVLNCIWQDWNHILLSNSKSNWYNLCHDVLRGHRTIRKKAKVWNFFRENLKR